jgi:uncharacterized protein YbjT (DUF2867 family)
MTILVTGATGNVGSEVLARLFESGDDVIAARRPAPSDGADPSDSRARVVDFDFLDPSTFDGAFAGITTVFLVRPPALSNVQRDIVPALEAARRNGVQHVVFLSLQGADKSSIVPHAKVEKWLAASGMRFTFLRPSFFMQNLSTTHRSDIRDRDEIMVPAGGGATAFIDVLDIADAAVVVLREPDRYIDAALTITGSEALTYDEVAGILSRELGRPIRYARPGALRYAVHAHRQLGMPLAMVLVTAAIYTTARLGLAASLTTELTSITGRRPRTFEQFAHRERAVWTATPEAH